MQEHSRTTAYLTPVDVRKETLTLKISSASGPYHNTDDISIPYTSSANCFCGGSADAKLPKELSWDENKSCTPPFLTTEYNADASTENEQLANTISSQYPCIESSEENCKQACEVLNKITKNKVPIWIARSTESKREVICCLETDNITIPRDIDGYEIITASIDEVKYDAYQLPDLERNRMGNNEKAEEARIVIEQSAEKLFKNHKNLSMISASPYRIKGAKKEYGWCIVCYCACKGYIPDGETAFPEYVDDFVVDVREGIFSLGTRHKANYELPERCQASQQHSIGECIHFEDSGMLETLGTFVSLENGATGILTCAHASIPRDKLVNYKSYLDAKGSDLTVYDGCKNIIGHVEDCLFEYGKSNTTSVDAAVIRLKENFVPTYGQFKKSDQNLLEDIGFTENRPPCTCSGQFGPLDTINNECFKYGCTTGLTKGCVLFRGAALRGSGLGFEKDKPSFVMFGQIHIGCTTSGTFFDVGDSGSVVFQKSESTDVTAVALAIGKINNECVATPLEHVLKALNITSLKVFPCDKPSYVSIVDSSNTSESSSVQQGEYFNQDGIRNQSSPKPCRMLDPIVFKSMDGHEVRGKNLKIICKDQTGCTDFISRDLKTKDPYLMVTSSSGHVFYGSPDNNWIWRKVYDKENSICVYQYT